MFSSQSKSKTASTSTSTPAPRASDVLRYRNVVALVTGSRITMTLKVTCSDAAVGEQLAAEIERIKEACKCGHSFEEWFPFVVAAMLDHGFDVCPIVQTDSAMQHAGMDAGSGWQYTFVKRHVDANASDSTPQ
jgi:hypothetical protein